MAAAVSPTPAGLAPAVPLARRTSQRQALRRPPSRVLRRQDSNLGQSRSQYSAMHDSSDDEIPVPMKLSALTKALLDDEAPRAAAPPNPPPSAPRTRRRSALSSSTSASQEERRHLRSGSSQPYEARPSRTSSAAGSPAPPGSRESSPVRRRVVRLSTTPKSLSQMKRQSTSQSRPSLQRRSLSRPPSRDKSSSSDVDGKAPPPPPPPPPPPAVVFAAADLNTPAQQPRVVRIASGSSAARGGGRSTTSSALSSANRSAHVSAPAYGSGAEADAVEEPGTVARHGGSVSRAPSGLGRLEDNPAPQSLRVKRIGKVPGSFLSGPARRGRRRQSEEEAEGTGEGDRMVGSQERGSRLSPELDNVEEGLGSPFYASSKYADFASGSPVSSKDLHRRHAPMADVRMSSARHSPPVRPSPLSSHREAEYAPSPEQRHRAPEIPSSHDQENELPEILRQSKPFVFSVKPAAEEHAAPRRPPSTDVGSAGRPAASPERKPLASISHNTPHRAAPPPPPPKMSVVHAATAPAGASTTQTRQRRNVIRVNGKSYTRLDVVGRGGSAKVYRVTAENGKMWALKRVSLEHADENSVRGFKSEIDLLMKLAKVERVINLLDYEMNDEKKVLTLVMELGEIDFNQLLKTRQPQDAGRFDPVFVRYYWKEMLECLLGVHEDDVVHSDLKPQNFVVVQGRLKLIDFGIANAIQTNETVHVHRDTQIGTPNYMSPESLMDYNALRGGARAPGQPRLMKLGKASDVWSLGCILYQMVYGVAPFAHIANQMARCQAIIDWDYAVEFPARGMGGVPVPPSLARTMRRCISRDPHLRPTCEELLHHTDPFLYPAEAVLDEGRTPIDEQLLARIIHSVVGKCREKMPTEAEAMSIWPAAYWASVKKAMNANRT